MSVPTSQQLQENIDREQERIDRLEKARDQFLAQWEKIEKEQTDLAEILRVYMDKIKMRDVLQTIHSIKE